MMCGLSRCGAARGSGGEGRAGREGRGRWEGRGPYHEEGRCGVDASWSEALITAGDATPPVQLHPPTHPNPPPPRPACCLQVGDDTLSVLEIWGAEYQENDALLIKAEHRAQLQAICDWERCLLLVGGEGQGRAGGSRGGNAGACA